MFFFLGMFYSFIAIKLKSYLGSSYIFLCAYRELFMLLCLVKWGLDIIIRKHLSITGMILLALFIYGSGLGYLVSGSVYNVITGARDFFFPIFVFFFFKENKKIISSPWLFVVIFTAFVVHVLCAAYFSLTFNGTVQNIWFFDLLGRGDEVRLIDATNFIKNGRLRSFGLFITPLEYSVSVLLPLFGSAYLILFHQKPKTKFAGTILGVLFLFGLWIGATRTPWVAIPLVVLMMLVVRYLRKFKASMVLGGLILLFTLTLLYVNSGVQFLNDASSKGRFNQYSGFIVDMKNSVLGYGLGNVSAKANIGYDSTVLDFAAIFGLFAIIPISVYLGVFRTLLGKYDYFRKISDRGRKILYFTVVAFFVAILYSALFQAVASYATIPIMMFLAAELIKYSENSRHDQLVLNYA